MLLLRDGDAELIDPTDDGGTLASAVRRRPAFTTAEVSRLDLAEDAQRAEGANLAHTATADDGGARISWHASVARRASPCGRRASGATRSLALAVLRVERGGSSRSSTGTGRSCSRRS